MYCELIDSFDITRRIVSANTGAIESCLSLSQSLLKGMLLVNTISSNFDALTRSGAGPDITQCEAIARTDFAPASNITSAALQIVPAVSTISSTRITFLPSTSPIIWIDYTWLALARVLWQSTRGTCKYLE